MAERNSGVDSKMVKLVYRTFENDRLKYVKCFKNDN